MANPTNTPNNPPRPVPIGNGAPPPQTPTPAPAPVRQADPLTKPGLVDALGSVMMMDFNEGERSRDQLLKLLPRTIHHPVHGEIEIEYRSWNPQQAVEESLYPFAKPVTREHFNKWIPDAYFAGAASPLQSGQTSGTLPSGRDQIWFWLPAKKAREMYARDMQAQNSKMKRLARAEKTQLDTGDGATQGTYVATNRAKITSEDATVND